MYTKQDLINKLINQSSYIDFESIYSSFVNWNIIPAYIDEKNIEYFDDKALEKLNQAIDLKNQGKNDCEINSIINEAENILNIDNKSLNQLAELISKKISNEILESIMNTAKLKRDNEILALQIEKLITENSNLTSKVKVIEEKNSKFKQIYGPIYIKSS